MTRATKTRKSAEQRMDEAFDAVRRAWAALYRAQLRVHKIKDKMGDDAWHAYAASRGVDSSLDTALADAGA